MRTLVFFACAIALAAHAQQTDAGAGSADSPSGGMGSAPQGSSGSATGTSGAGATAGQQRSGGAAAGAGAAMHAPRPDPALTAAFRDSVGSWKCTGTMSMPKEMGGAEIQTRSQMTIRRDLNGFAYVGDWRVEKTEAFPGAHGKMTWSYNTPSKKFWEFAVDDTGSVMRGESDGEQGGKMVWNEEGTMMGKPSKMRSTIVKKDKQSIEMTFESQDDGGSWTPMGKDSCTKATATAGG
jgi:hypothetical protein